MIKTLTTATTLSEFPLGTTDTPWTFVVTGTLADGAAFSQSVSSDTPSASMDLPVGTGYVLVVSKNGVSSLPSDPVDVVVPVTVQLQVPDATQRATIG